MFLFLIGGIIGYSYLKDKFFYGVEDGIETETELEPNGGRSMIFDEERNILFIGSEKGLGIYDVMNDTYRIVDFSKISGRNDGRIKHVIIDANNEFLYFSYYYGIAKYNIERGLRDQTYPGEKIDDFSPDFITFNNRTNEIIYGGYDYYNNVYYDYENNILFEGRFVYNNSLEDKSHPIGGYTEFYIHYYNNNTYRKRLVLNNYSRLQSFIYNVESKELYIGVYTLDDSSKFYGIIVYDIYEDSVRYINNTHGLPSNKVYSMVLDEKNGELYIGTYGNGLSIYSIDNKTIKNIGEESGLFSSNKISSLALDTKS